MFNKVSAQSFSHVAYGVSVIILASCGGGNSSDRVAATSPPLAIAGNSPTTTRAVLKLGDDQDQIPGPFGQDASQYSLAFHDEFDGDALDSDKWTDHIWYDPPSSTADYDVRGGTLNIWPERNAEGEFAERILVTDGKYYQTYGYFEMEAKLPVGSGVWPAFWLLNTDGEENSEPEIDIMEAYSGDTSGVWANVDKHPIHYDASYFENGANFPGQAENFVVGDADLSAGFHKYAVKWEPEKLSYYFDGELVATSNVAISKRMYMLVNIQYGSASGDTDETTPTGPSNAFEVKYVRSWNFN